MDYFKDGQEAAWAEFVDGDSMPTVDELVANVRNVCGYTLEDAQEFARGWLYQATRMQRCKGEMPWHAYC